MEIRKLICIPARVRLFLAVGMLVLALTAFSFSKQAQACDCVAGCGCSNQVAQQIMTLLRVEHTATDEYITLQFELHRQWMVDVFFRRYILAAMMRMVEQLSAVAMDQMMIIGAFLDAKEIVETQRLFQQLSAEAHRDYHPSEGLCSMGTVLRSTGGSERRGDMVALVMAQRSIDRQMSKVNSSGGTSPAEDKRIRARIWRDNHCDPNDSNGTLNGVCNGTTPVRRNRDIDFTRTLGTPLTVDVNFDDGVSSNDEVDIVAMANYLYAHDLMHGVPAALLNSGDPKVALAKQTAMMQSRSVMAKRSVAENSFNIFVGMKSAGANPAPPAGPPTAQYMRALLQEMGFSPAEAASFIGGNPSYWAQMEVLTKKIFHSPQFYVDLYDKPANVSRKGAALQALSLLQQRDTFDSTLRSEQLLSLILEIELIDAEDALINKMSDMDK